MRTRLSALTLCLLFTGCPQGPQPKERPEPTPTEVDNPEIVPIQGASAVELRSPLPPATRRSRYSKIQMNYRIQTSELAGFAGRQYERSKEESFSAEVLRPQTIRRQYQLSTNRIVAKKDGKVLGKQVGQTALHGQRVTVQQGESGILETWDESGPLDAETSQQMVFDLLSLRALMPGRRVTLGESWQAPSAAITQILGATETGRKIDGSIRCTARRLVKLGGQRAAEIGLQLTIRMTDRKVVQGKIEYQMTTRLTLNGTYYHAIDEQRPLKLSLEGKAVLDHKPLRVDFIPPGTEPLTKPFHAEGSMSVLLRFP